MTDDILARGEAIIRSGKHRPVNQPAHDRFGIDGAEVEVETVHPTYDWQPDEPPDNGFHDTGQADDRHADDDEPLYVDIGALLDGTLPEPPKPAVLARTDGRCIFYRGETNLIYGDPEDGKTWIALAACAETLRGDGRVLFIDLDHNGVDAVSHNLLLLGAPTDALRTQDRFRYCEPDTAMWIVKVVEDCTLWPADVAVIDSIGELLPLFGSDSNSSDDYTGTANRVMRPLTKTDACGIAIDHLAKGADSRKQGPGGAMAKRRMLGGTSIRVKRGRQFIPGHGGSAHLYINKDRHGGLRRHCPPAREQDAGTFVMDAPDEFGRTGWCVTEPVPTIGAEATQARYRQAVDELLQMLDHITVDDVAATVSGETAVTAAQREQSRYYLNQFTDDGWLEVAETGGRGKGKAKRWRRSRPPGEEEPLF